jgi:predicted nucleic acid-binding protein
MKPPAAVIDTNVVVSGVLTALSASPTVRILDAMLRGGFRFLFSIELLAEYRAVLLRSRIRSRHRLSEAEVDVLLADIATNGVVLEGESSITPKDVGDDVHLWRLLAREPSAVLVTGDKRLFNQPAMKARILTPRTFADLLEE